MDLSQLYCFMNMTKIQTLIFLIFNIFDKKNIREERERKLGSWLRYGQKSTLLLILNRHNAPAQKKMPNSSFQNVRGRTQANTPSLCPMLMALRLPTSQWLFWVR